MAKGISKKIEEVIGSETLNTLEKNKIGVYFQDQTGKYSTNKLKMKLCFFEGYDLLQYLIVVEPYILKKFSIKEPLELKALLYVFPMQYFTIGDFKILKILRHHNITLKGLVESGYFKIAVKFPVVNKSIYTLTDRSVKIVRDYYSYLSGEKVIYPNSNLNPFRNEESAKVDLEREKVMEKLKHQAEKNPSKFRRALY